MTQEEEIEFLRGKLAFARDEYRKLQARLDKGTSMYKQLRSEHIELKARHMELLAKQESPKRKNFIPPTLIQVKEYVAEKEFNIDPEEFIDFYESKGWHVGKNKMKDWKAALRTWGKRDNNQMPIKPKSKKLTEPIDWIKKVKAVYPEAKITGWENFYQMHPDLVRELNLITK